jgi:hypothetical protein
MGMSPPSIQIITVYLGGANKGPPTLIRPSLG